MKEVIQDIYAPAVRQWRKWNKRQRVTVIWWQFSLLFVMISAENLFLLAIAILNFSISSNFLIKVPTDELGDD